MYSARKETFVACEQDSNELINDQGRKKKTFAILTPGDARQGNTK